MKQVTLSFDNGPDPQVTPRVVDILGKHGIKTTFFVIGEKLLNPAGLAVTKRCSDEGHWIGNHTFTHSPPLGERIDPDTAFSEIGRTQLLIGPLAHPDKLFRPSGGKGNLDKRLLNEACFKYLVQDRYSCVLWHCVPGDLWGPSVDWVAKALASIDASDWTLVVLHDIANGSVERLDEFIVELQKRDVTIRQDFPDDCVPMRCGTPVLAMDQFVSGC
jgi:peptidoglycan/xylan/chitin deacetylase (PgdA/CDA1 family)